MLPARVPTAVLDTNLIVRLLISPQGLTSQLLTALLEHKYRLVTSEPLLAELASTLRYPRLQKYGPFDDQDVRRVLGTLRRIAQMVPGDYSGLNKVPTDAKDNVVVACALEAQADFIVTDDRRDLLPLKIIQLSGFRVVQIVRPRTFLRLLG